MTPWLHIVGIGEDSMEGLTPATRTVVEAAEVIVGGARHHVLSANDTVEMLEWPSPFDALITELEQVIPTDAQIDHIHELGGYSLKKNASVEQRKYRILAKNNSVLWIAEAEFKCGPPDQCDWVFQHGVPGVLTE